jgi:hypothetical protein
MKAQTLAALAMALAPSLCNAATFAKPFNIDFYQKDKGSYPSFLGHLRFNSTDDVKRTFHWRLKDVHEITVRHLSHAAYICSLDCSVTVWYLVILELPISFTTLILVNLRSMMEKGPI